MDSHDRRERFHAYLTTTFPRVYNYVLRLVRQPATAEDLTQDAFLKAWRAFDQYDRQKDFLPWILQIARHTTLDYLRKHKELLDESLVEQRAGAAPSPEQALLNAEKTQRLDEALQKLPEAQRTAIFLYYVEQLDTAALAKIMRGTQAGVMSLLHRARQGMKKLLKDLR